MAAFRSIERRPSPWITRESPTRSGGLAGLRAAIRALRSAPPNSPAPVRAGASCDVSSSTRGNGAGPMGVRHGWRGECFTWNATGLESPDSPSRAAIPAEGGSFGRDSIVSRATGDNPPRHRRQPRGHGWIDSVPGRRVGPLEAAVARRHRSRPSGFEFRATSASSKTTFMDGPSQGPDHADPTHSEPPGEALRGRRRCPFQDGGPILRQLKTPFGRAPVAECRPNPTS